MLLLLYAPGEAFKVYPTRSLIKIGPPALSFFCVLLTCLLSLNCSCVTLSAPLLPLLQSPSWLPFCSCTAARQLARAALPLLRSCLCSSPALCTSTVAQVALLVTCFQLALLVTCFHCCAAGSARLLLAAIPLFCSWLRSSPARCSSACYALRTVVLSPGWRFLSASLLWLRWLVLSGLLLACRVTRLLCVVLCCLLATRGF